MSTLSKIVSVIALVSMAGSVSFGQACDTNANSFEKSLIKDCSEQNKKVKPENRKECAMKLFEKMSKKVKTCEGELKSKLDQFISALPADKK